MNTTQKLIVDTLLARRGYGESDEVPDEIGKEIAADAFALVAALPDDAGVDFLRVMETWADSTTRNTSALLDMMIAATLRKVLESRHGASPSRHANDNGLSGVEWSSTEPNTVIAAEITITAAEFRAIAEHYDWDRVESEGGWTLRLRKISEMSSAAG